MSQLGSAQLKQLHILGLSSSLLSCCLSMDVGQELERGSQGHQLWSGVSDCLRGAWGRRRGMQWPEAAAEACSGRAQRAAAGPLVPPRARRRASATCSGCGNWHAVARGEGDWRGEGESDWCGVGRAGTVELSRGGGPRKETTGFNGPNLIWPGIFGCSFELVLARELARAGSI